jgi:uncharacterized protein (TIGR03435 family)
MVLLEGETDMLRALILGVLAILATTAQQTTASFDAASIRPSLPGQNQGIDATPGNLAIRNTRLADAICWAYNIQPYQLVGPGWLNDLRFDISARAATPAPQNELRLMLQALLADRFKLAVHRDSKEMPVLLLSVSKNGHKLKENNSDGESSFKTASLRLRAEGATVGQLADFLGREMRTPILDRTGLAGRYDFALDINSFVTDEIRQASRNGPPLEAPAIIGSAMQEQLGLKLDSSKAPISMLVVDSIEKQPTEN